MMRAAEKIRASGLPTRTVPDKLVRAVLEDGSLEDDEHMRELWANLLANGATESAGVVHPGFPDVLRQLDRLDALVLDLMHRPARGERPPPEATLGWPILWSSVDLAAFLDLPPDGVGRARLENLVRLGVCWYPPKASPSWDDLTRNRLTQHDLVTLSHFGVAFVEACQTPRPVA